MDLPSGPPAASAPPLDPSLRAAARSPRRRRPTGAAPPLPYRLQTSGVRWLVAALVLVGLTLAIFARGLHGPAVTATVIDDAVVRWLAGLAGPGMEPLLRGLARIASWPVLYVTYFALFLTLLALRRWRHLVVWWVAVQAGPSSAPPWRWPPGGHARSGSSSRPAGAAGRCRRCRSPS